MLLPRRRFFQHSAALALPVASLSGLVGCAGFGAPSVITLSEVDLGVLVNRAFPMQRRLFELMDVTLTVPTVRLRPETNRVAVTLDVAAQERLFSHAMKGRLAFDSTLRYENLDGSVRLQQVRVSQLSVDGGAAVPGGLAAALPPAVAASAGQAAPRVAERLGQTLAERMLENLSIYKVDPDQLERMRQAGRQPSAVTVTARGVEITLAQLR